MEEERAENALLPFDGWVGLAIRAVTGAAVYGVLCLAWWKLSGCDHLKALLRGKERKSVQ